MSYDGIVLRAVVTELNESLLGARIDKIYQPTKHEIILTLHQKGGASAKLLLSSLPQEARVHLVSQTPPNPLTPPLFCMVMRKHLEGGKIIALTQPGFERVLKITCEVIDELGEKALRQIIVEIMGKHSNILLTDPSQNKIIDAVHRVPVSVSRYRQVLPGLPYLCPPPQNKLAPDQDTREEFYERLLALPLGTALDKAVLKTVSGVSPQSVAEILFRSGLKPLQSLEFCGEYELRTLWQILSMIGAKIKEGHFSPEVIQQNKQPATFSAIALTSYPDASRLAFSTMNETLDYYYLRKNKALAFQQRKANLEALVKREIIRCEKKAGLQYETILNAQNADQYRLWGELLTARLYQLSPGKEARVPNYYDPEEKIEIIPLDDQLTVGDNAQHYFSLYQKAKNAAVKAEKQLRETNEELTYLYSLISSLDSITTLPEIAEIQDEFREAGYLQSADSKKSSGNKGKSGIKSKTGKAKKQQTFSEPQKILHDSWVIFIGKNNKQNDLLTMKIAKAEDLWLHTKDIPGSHIIIKNPEHREIPPQILEEAAMLAAYHSQARGSANVPVDYTLRKNVWKPTGAKPGFVLYDHQHTVYVTPEPEKMTGILTETSKTAE